VTAATLRQQIANGKLRAEKRGRDWHVTPKEVERYRKESQMISPRHVDRTIDKDHTPRPANAGPFCTQCGRAITRRPNVHPPRR
jgi:hypothetical protein